jgi:hypothetical protein
LKYAEKRYKNIRIAKQNAISIEDLQKSKVLRNYADMNLIDEDKALEEFKKRADFLEVLANANFGGRELNTIEMYYEIK